jgi:hypothetical protein
MLQDLKRRPGLQIALGLAALVACGVAAAFILEDSPASDDGPGGSARNPATEERSDVSPAPVVPAAVRVEPYQSFDPNEFEVESVAEHRVLVTDEQDRPLAHAQVELWGLASVRELQEAANPAAEADGERRLRVIVADHLGVANLSPLPRGPFQIIARGQGRVGVERVHEKLPRTSQLIDASSISLRVRALPTRELTVVCRDPDGQALPYITLEFAGGRIGTDEPRGPYSRRPGTLDVPLRGVRTDASGIAVVSIGADQPRLFEAKRWNVSAVLPGQMRREVTVELTETTSRVELSLPSTKRLDLRFLLGSSLSRPEPQTTLTYVVLESPQSAAPDPYDHGSTGTLHVLDSQASIGGFAKRSRVRLILESRHRSRVVQEVLLGDSESTSVDVQLGEELRILTARLQEPSGAWVRKSRFRYDFRTSQNADVPIVPSYHEVFSDDQGRIRVPVPSMEGHLVLLDAATSRVDQRPPQAPPVLASIPLTLSDQGTLYDAGTVPLNRGELVVEGSVLVKDGASRASKGMVSVEWRDRSESSAGGDGWKHIASVVTDAENRFMIFDQHRPVPSSEIRVTGWMKQRKSESVLCVTGSRNVNLRIPDPGGLRGSVTCAAENLRESVRVAVQHEGATTSAAFPVRFEPGASTGVFAVDGLAPGVYELQVRVGTFVAQSIAGVLVMEGQVTESSQLEGLSVGPDFVLAEIRVVDHQGRDLPGVQVQIRPSKLDRPLPRIAIARTGVTDRLGRVTFPVSRAEARVVVARGKGFAVEVVESPQFPLTMILRPGRHVQVQLNEPIPELPPVSWYRVALVARSGIETEDEALKSLRAVTVAAGTLSIDCRDVGAGIHDLVVQLVPAGDMELRRRLLEARPTVVATIEVPSAGGSSMLVRAEATYKELNLP